MKTALGDGTSTGGSKVDHQKTQASHKERHDGTDDTTFHVDKVAGKKSKNLLEKLDFSGI